MNTENSVERRNYALTTQTFDAEHLLQISCGGVVLVTVCAPAGPSEPQEFLVHNGDGLDDQDEDLPRSAAVKVFPTGHDVQAAWRQAARHGYLHALGKMMIADEREERELYGLAA